MKFQETFQKFGEGAREKIRNVASIVASWTREKVAQKLPTYYKESVQGNDGFVVIDPDAEVILDSHGDIASIERNAKGEMLSLALRICDEDHILWRKMCRLTVDDIQKQHPEVFVKMCEIAWKTFDNLPESVRSDSDENKNLSEEVFPRNGETVEKWVGRMVQDFFPIVKKEAERKKQAQAHTQIPEINTEFVSEERSSIARYVSSFNNQHWDRIAQLPMREIQERYSREYAMMEKLSSDVEKFIHENEQKEILSSYESIPDFSLQKEETPMQWVARMESVRPIVEKVIAMREEREKQVIESNIKDDSEILRTRNSYINSLIARLFPDNTSVYDKLREKTYSELCHSNEEEFREYVSKIEQLTVDTFFQFESNIGVEEKIIQEDETLEQYLNRLSQMVKIDQMTWPVGKDARKMAKKIVEGVEDGKAVWKEIRSKKIGDIDNRYRDQLQYIAMRLGVTKPKREEIVEICIQRLAQNGLST